MTTQEKPQAISSGMRVRVQKGCAAFGIAKGTTLQIQEVIPLGVEYSHQVRVVFSPLNGFKTGKVFAFYARHPNRLSDSVVRMNSGDPTRTLEIVRSVV